jgi:hypothetical protein
MCSNELERHHSTKQAPLLTHVVLWNTSIWLLKFNWSSLTILKFRKLFPAIISKDILSILRETIDLLELTIKLEWDIDSKGGRLIHLPHLECLSIAGVAFLTILDAPSLQQLKIDQPQ